MRDALPQKAWENESAVINLSDSSGSGTHWVAYKKRGNRVYYYDSFGSLRPPVELISYWGEKSDVYYNYRQDQNFDTFNCGHLCLKFLSE